MTQWIALLLSSSSAPKKDWSPIGRFVDIEYPTKRWEEYVLSQNQTTLPYQTVSDASDVGSRLRVV
jgi:hypothetical protein